jgi:hypothetical protein
MEAHGVGKSALVVNGVVENKYEAARIDEGGAVVIIAAVCALGSDWRQRQGRREHAASQCSRTALLFVVSSARPRV